MSPLSAIRERKLSLEISSCILVSDKIVNRSFREGTNKLIFFARHVGDVHVVGGWAKIFQFFPGENIDGNEMDLGMSVLASLRSAHFDNFARTIFDHDETVLPKSRALHRIGGRCASISAFESVLMLWFKDWVRIFEAQDWRNAGGVGSGEWGVPRTNLGIIRHNEVFSIGDGKK